MTFNRFQDAGLAAPHPNGLSHHHVLISSAAAMFPDNLVSHQHALLSPCSQLPKQPVSWPVAASRGIILIITPVALLAQVISGSSRTTQPWMPGPRSASAVDAAVAKRVSGKVAKSVAGSLESIDMRKMPCVATGVIRFPRMQ